MSAPFAVELLRWYRRNRADLPWRRQPTPYMVWLSEIMLQQTQVDTVVPYFQRFLKAFPTIEALACAHLDEVLKLWEGLGYYSRARNLHRAAAIIVERYDGEIPGDVDELLKLPGVGRYTAGAIGSIAFDLSVPLLDGNVMRVFTRLRDIDSDISLHSTREALWSLAAEWTPEQDAGEYNQALMELGRKICRPQKPDCEACPLRLHCRAYAAGTQKDRPLKRARAATPHYDVCAGLIRDAAGRLLIAQRPLEGLLGGLWEFPGGKREADESLPDCLARELREELAIEVEIGDLFAKVNHAFTHFKITLHAYECRYLGAIAPFDEPQALEALNWAWVNEADLDEYSFGKADRLVIAALRERRGMML
ncbi:MAG: A/G-specific adenine glycosylase [Chloroflexota bacterium]|nr:A/G-specific adenine glycosylase [Chloroflexota bacterium]